MIIALSSAHRGRKIWPQWLGVQGQSRASHFAATALAGLPIYPCRIHEGVNDLMDILGIRTADQDHEEYLTRHRWGFLLERMLDNCVDWRACIEACLQWTKANSDTAGPAWEPYSACERVANLAVFLAAVPAATRAQGIAPEIREFLDRSVRWVYGHLEYYGPTETNNHILNNARALVLGGIVGGDSTAVSAGMQIFRRCLPEMILSGGFLRERSSHYQLVVLNWVLDAWRFVAAAEGPDGEDTRFLAGYADRMRTAASMLCGRGTSLLGVIGDVSPDITPAQSLGRLALLYSDWWPHAYWSESPAVADGWFRLSKGDEMVMGNFPQGKFPCDFPTHGHSDHTSFVWSHDGKEVLVDPGRHRYTPDAVSLAQVGAESHNLPTVNGLAPLCESMVQHGGWWPLPYAAAQLRAAVVTDGIVLEHDGFARATPVNWYSRRIELQPGGLQVVDSFGGNGTADLSFHWHFGQGFENFDSSRMLAIGNGANVQIDVGEMTGTRARIPLLVEILSGRISPQYGRTLPSIRVRLGCRVKLPATIATKFSWVAGAG